MKREDTGDPDAVLHEWDKAFYTEILEEKYSIDEKKIGEYFLTEHVVKETLNIYQELLGLKFTQVADTQLWS